MNALYICNKIGYQNIRLALSLMQQMRTNTNSEECFSLLMSLFAYKYCREDECFVKSEYLMHTPCKGFNECRSVSLQYFECNPFLRLELMYQNKFFF